MHHGPTAPRRRDALTEFLHEEATAGVVLVLAAVSALVWANSPWRHGYGSVWHHALVVRAGSHALALDLRHWVNDGLMTLFFFVAGLEIKRELVIGELRAPRRAALPAVAALGGMAVPALVSLAVAPPGSRAGWGIPMATDIAMAVGILAVVGRRVPPSLRLFLLALAIVDDIGAIVVIAIFYAAAIDWWMVVAALGLVAVVVGMRAAGVQRVAWYLPAGVALWLATYESGVHATIAGVALGLLTPVALPRAGGDVPVAPRLERALHPVSAFVVVPVFALANAGVPVGSGALAAALRSRVALAVVLGLVVGKPVGITLAAWLAVRLRIGELPAGARWSMVFAVASVAGVGFTVSLFVTDLAFPSAAVADHARLAVLAGSAVSAVAGAVLVRTAARRGTRQPVPDQVV